MRHRIDGFTLASIDLLTALVVTFAAMAVLSILAAQSHAKAGVHPGSLVVTLRWEMVRNADVDLWVKPPGDRAVGFSSRTDAHCDLVRDDLGRALDRSSRNQEMVVCRVAPSGEWVIDAMLYRSYDHVLPVAAKIVVQRLDGRGAVILLEREVSLRFEGEQTTVARFVLNTHGAIEPGSVSRVPMVLYAGIAAQ